MKIPKKLKIGGHIIKIDCSKEIEDTSGESDLKRNTIKLCPSMSQSQKEATLIHEIFHFLNTTMDGSDLGHAFMDGLSEQFYQVLKDNKLLKE